MNVKELAKGGKRKILRRFGRDEFGLNEGVRKYIEKTKLFDREFYFSKYPDVAEKSADPLRHFLRHGEGEGRLPHENYNELDVQKYVLEEDGRILPGSLFAQYVHLVRRRSRKKPYAYQHRRWKNIDFEKLWVTPWFMQLAFKSGCYRLGYQLGARNESTADAKEVELDGSHECRLIIPIVAITECLQFVRIGVERIDRGARLRLGVWQSLSSERLEVATVSSTDIEADGMALFDTREIHVEKGARHFVRVWAEDGTASIRAAEHRAAYHDKRSLHFAGIDHRSSLPRVFTEQDKKTVVFGTRGGMKDSAEVIDDLVSRIDSSMTEFVYPDSDYAQMIEVLSDARFAIFLCGIRERFGDKSLLRLLDSVNSNGGCSIYLEPQAKSERDAGSSPDEHRLYDYVIGSRRRHGTVWREWLDMFKGKSGSVPSRITSPRSISRLPIVVVVTVIYKKIDQLESFIKAIYRQNYPGRITIAVVDDCSPDGAEEKIRDVIRKLSSSKPSRIDIRVYANETNIGNCGSRNLAMEKSKGDIYTVIDCDCLVNRDFVRSHVRNHLIYGADAVVGPLNIETDGKPGWQLLEELEEGPERARELMKMQDPVQLNGFVNCVTRNLSVSSKWLEANGGFDPEFAYSAAPESGFGWEDVELGCRIYRSGADIFFTADAFSIHQSHSASIPEWRQVTGSAKNFNRLFDKHPELANVVRRWSVETAFKIQEWAGRAGVSDEQVDIVRERFSQGQRRIKPYLQLMRAGSPRLRIALYRWHAPHQYELFKLPHDFCLISHTGTVFTNNWPYQQRPLRENVRMIRSNDFDDRDFDLAILHVDENVLCSDLSNGVLGSDWGDSFLWFLENVNLPKIAICHGTPPFLGQYAANKDEIEEFCVIEEERNRLKEALWDCEVVCNSYQADKEWCFNRSRVIWHGMDPQEFPPVLRPDLQVISHGIDSARPHYRGAHFLHRVLDLLDEGISVSTHDHKAPGLIAEDDRNFAQISFRSWVNHLRRHRAYLNTTLRSPMPRSRTEAMMCGVVPVSLRNHDVDRFIRNGVNGFYGETPEELTGYVEFLMRDENAWGKISKEARSTAIDIFNHDRFLSQWTELLGEIVG